MAIGETIAVVLVVMWLVCWGGMSVGIASWLVIALNRRHCIFGVVQLT